MVARRFSSRNLDFCHVWKLACSAIMRQSYASSGVSAYMKPHETARSRTFSILTDIHFWVPAAVLLGGLLLLRFLH